MLHALGKVRMKPELDKSCRVADLKIYHIIAMVIKEHLLSFDARDLCLLCLVNRNFNDLVPKVI
jgi:hypothetical protein